MEQANVDIEVTEIGKIMAAVYEIKGIVGDVAEAWYVKFGIKLSIEEEKNGYGQCLNLIADCYPMLNVEKVQIRPDVMDAIDKPQWSDILAKMFELLMEKVQKQRFKQYQNSKIMELNSD